MMLAYDEMNDWQKMKCRLGHYLTCVIKNGKPYYYIQS